jgi:hypothetical protein
MAQGDHAISLSGARPTTDHPLPPSSLYERSHSRAAPGSYVKLSQPLSSHHDSGITSTEDLAHGTARPVPLRCSAALFQHNQAQLSSQVCQISYIHSDSGCYHVLGVAGSAAAPEYAIRVCRRRTTQFADLTEKLLMRPCYMQGLPFKSQHALLAIALTATVRTTPDETQGGYHLDFGQ